MVTNHVLLGVVQPEENIPAYKDALSSLADKLTYLYRSSDNRYWFDTRPTLKKTVSDRAGLQTPNEIIYNLENELKQICRTKDPFEAVHISTTNTGDIPDTMGVRLVLLNPTQVYKSDNSECAALTAAKDHYENRGTSPRIYRNMIVFLAPDSAVTAQLKHDMSHLMAWRSIEKDITNLNLDNNQQREVKDSIQHYETTVRDRLQEAYSWLIIPTQDGTNPVTWSVSRISGSNNPVSKVDQKMRDDESFIEAMSPRILSMDMTRFNLWKDNDHILVRELWDDHTKYVYLHRLKNQAVLFKTLEAGVKSGEYFAYAESQNAEGEYEALVFGPSGSLHITLDCMIVKAEAAKRQLESSSIGGQVPIGSADEVYDTGTQGSNNESPGSVPQFDSSHQTEAKPKYNHFFGTVKLSDLTKIAKTTGDINLEILQHFAKLSKSSINVKLDIEVSIPDGVSEDFMRTINENCRTLKFETNEFDEV